RPDLGGQRVLQDAQRQVHPVVPWTFGAAVVVARRRRDEPVAPPWHPVHRAPLAGADDLDLLQPVVVVTHVRTPHGHRSGRTATPLPRQRTPPRGCAAPSRTADRGGRGPAARRRSASARRPGRVGWTATPARPRSRRS